jgi:flavin reductase (DIM6/NTAB) family NADH-FMN oxidoreductase RutF
VIDPSNFRRCCSKFATGVTVATVMDAAGAPHGLTVNSFTSVSLVPPLVLICIDYSSNVLPMFRQATHYGINILGVEQRDLSTRFAMRGQDRFDGVAWQPGETNVPLIADALAYFECAVRHVVEAGDHAIFVAQVERAVHREGKPLLYFDSGYRSLA